MPSYSRLIGKVKNLDSILHNKIIESDKVVIFWLKAKVNLSLNLAVMWLSKYLISEV